MLEKDDQWEEEMDQVLGMLSKSHLVKPLYRKNFPLIGQGQILRRHIAIDLSSRSRLESATYIRSLQCLNKALIRREKAGPEQAQGMPAPLESKLMEKVSQHLEYSGQQNPFHKVYHTFVEHKDDDSIGITLVLLAVLFTHDYVWQGHQQSSRNTHVAVIPAKKNKHTPDVTTACVGFMTTLHQVPLSIRTEFLRLLQRVYRTKLKRAVDSNQLNPSAKIGNEVLVLSHFLRLVIQLMGGEAHTMPKLLDDATMDIDVDLVA